MDDLSRSTFGLTNSAFWPLYHFAIGVPSVDNRLSLFLFIIIIFIIASLQKKNFYLLVLCFGMFVFISHSADMRHMTTEKICLQVCLTSALLV